MLYILECMFLLLLSTTSGNVGTLKTTGKPATLKDLGVAMLGWVILGFLILIIIYTIKSIINRKNIKRNIIEQNDLKRDENNSVSNDLLNKKSYGLLYVIECMTFALICMVGGTDSKMITTGEKPTRKEIIISVIGWGVVIVTIIVAVVFIHI